MKKNKLKTLCLLSSACYQHQDNHQQDEQVMEAYKSAIET